MTIETINRNHTTGLPDHIRMTDSGRLVLTGGAHNVVTLFTGQRAPSPDAIAAFRANHTARRDWCAVRGIRFAQWVFPDAIVLAGHAEVAAEAIGSDWLDVSEARSVYQTHFQPAGDDADIHYPLDVLRDYPTRQTLTDSHYSDLGNLYLAAHVADVMLDHRDPAHVAARADSARPKMITGDLGLQCTPQRQDERLVLAKQPHQRVASNGMAAGNNGIIIITENTMPPGTGTLLIFGDSFFREMLNELIPYWDNIIFVRSSHFHYEIVSAVRPATILTGMAERYIAAQVPDDQRPHFLAPPLIKGRAQTPDSAFPEMWTRLVDQIALAQMLDAAPLEAGTAPRPMAGMSAAQITEQTAFALWKMREGDASGLEGPARSAMWNAARPAYLEEASALLSLMGTRGLQISGSA